MRARRLRAGTRRVAAVELPFETLPNFEAAREYVLTRLIHAHKQGVRLAVLPAYTGLLTLHLFARSTLSTPEALREAAWRFGVAAEETLLDWSRGFSRALGLYLIPGTCLVPASTGLLHRSYIFSPSGQLLGHQDQTHIRAWEHDMGLVAGVELPVWDIDGLRLGIAVGSDAWTPEVGRILALQGATIMICPTAVPTPYSLHWQMAGVWQQVQANRLYGLECSSEGDLGGRRFQARSAVLAPLELTNDGRGYLADVDYSGRSKLISADLDLLRLLETRRRNPMARQFNTALYTASFPRLYRQRMAKAGLRPLVEED